MVDNSERQKHSIGQRNTRAALGFVSGFKAVSKGQKMIVLMCVEVKDKQDQIRVERNIGTPFLDTGVVFFGISLEAFEAKYLDDVRNAVCEVAKQKVSPAEVNQK